MKVTFPVGSYAQFVSKNAAAIYDADFASRYRVIGAVFAETDDEEEGNRRLLLSDPKGNECKASVAVSHLMESTDPDDTESVKMRNFSGVPDRRYRVPHARITPEGFMRGTEVEFDELRAPSDIMDTLYRPRYKHGTKYVVISVFQPSANGKDFVEVTLRDSYGDCYGYVASHHLKRWGAESTPLPVNAESSSLLSGKPDIRSTDSNVQDAGLDAWNIGSKIFSILSSELEDADPKDGPVAFDVVKADTEEQALHKARARHGDAVTVKQAIPRAWNYKFSKKP